jgi:hypothetical protein
MGPILYMLLLTSCLAYAATAPFHSPDAGLVDFCAHRDLGFFLVSAPHSSDQGIGLDQTNGKR